VQAIQQIRVIRDRFWRDLKVVGAGEELNQSLEKAGRVADFLELGELMCLDALPSTAFPCSVSTAPCAGRRPR
jgi:succinate dehydrogenase / fumarate reductase flavoprotein subunit